MFCLRYKEFCRQVGAHLYIFFFLQKKYVYTTNLTKELIFVCFDERSQKLQKKYYAEAGIPFYLYKNSSYHFRILSFFSFGQTTVTLTCSQQCNYCQHENFFSYKKKIHSNNNGAPESNILLPTTQTQHGIYQTKRYGEDVT